jgi:hypothetical protein
MTKRLGTLGVILTLYSLMTKECLDSVTLDLSISHSCPQTGLKLLSRFCAVCKSKPKNRCDDCGNEFCHLHSIRCDTCGTITCIRDLGNSMTCPTCDDALGICPDCLYNGELVRIIESARICPECGWSQ